MTDISQHLPGPPAASGAERIVLGGRFGEEPPGMSWRRLDYFAESGGRFVDTAHSYADGASERIIGHWLRANPGMVFIVDKIGHPSSSGRLDLSADSMVREAAESASRLGCQPIDVLMLHRDSPDMPVSELASTLVQLVEHGYAKLIGVCNWPPARLDTLAAVLSDRGHQPVISYQRSLAVPNAPLWPGALHADAAVRDVARSRGLTLLAWAAQARGYFTGVTELPAAGQADPFDSPDNRARRERCRELARELGVRTETAALAWLLSQPGTLPIVGPRSIAELAASLAATRLQLDAAQLLWLAEGTRC
jgi:aryl-alcohol dehydrogenase-like predicted oxidoreductase